VMIQGVIEGLEHQYFCQLSIRCICRRHGNCRVNEQRKGDNRGDLLNYDKGGAKSCCDVFNYESVLFMPANRMSRVKRMY
jgi:hypothetical protein